MAPTLFFGHPQFFATTLRLYGDRFSNETDSKEEECRLFEERTRGNGRAGGEEGKQPITLYFPFRLFLNKKMRNGKMVLFWYRLRLIQRLPFFSWTDVSFRNSLEKTTLLHVNGISILSKVVENYLFLVAILVF